MSRIKTLTLPENLKVELDLRDVVPIVINCNLKQKEVYKIAESGLDLKKECDKIIQLRQLGKSYHEIIDLIHEYNGTEPPKPQ